MPFNIHACLGGSTDINCKHCTSLVLIDTDDCRFQLRCLTETPLHVQQGQVISGQLRLVAHNRQSYDVFVDLTAPPLHPGQLPQKVTESTSMLLARHPLEHSYSYSQFALQSCGVFVMQSCGILEVQSCGVLKVQFCSLSYF